MAAAVNGMTLYGGVIPFGATFLVFADYLRPAIRVAAFSHIPSIFVFTHDSIGVGEDGPTHQPIEQLASLRVIPNLVTIRPADANEVTEAWKIAIARRDGPTALILTRQNLVTFERASAPAVDMGAYVLGDFGKGKLELILMASGSEVQLCVEAAKKLMEEGRSVRVVSFASWELFAKQDEAYRESVLPRDVKARVAVEAGTGFGWERFAGCDGRIISIDRYGASAPAKILFEKFGFTVENVLAKAKELL
jgi:transketolase